MPGHLIHCLQIFEKESFTEKPTLESSTDVYSELDDVTFLHIPVPLDKCPSESVSTF